MKECVVDFALFNDWESNVRIVLATKESLALLIEYGQTMVFMDGTYRLLGLPQHKLQTVLLVVRHHINGKVSTVQFIFLKFIIIQSHIIIMQKIGNTCSFLNNK